MKVSLKARRFALLCTLILNGIGVQALYGQHDWVWTFGDSVVMRFPNGWQAPLISMSERSRNTFEVGACYSDSSGTLSLWANADSIYNASFEPVENGRLWFSNPTFTQGILFVPAPSCDDSLFVFRLRYGPCGGPFSICISSEVVDRLGSDGNGKVMRTALSEYPGTSGALAEKLQAVRHADGKSWWIYVHDQDNADFYRYLLTSQGIGPPIKQTIGSPHEYFANNIHYIEGEMTFSPNGSKLLVAVGTGVLDLFDVDRCTGELSNWVQVSPPVARGPNNWYGCSFSPDGSKIYADELDLPYNSSLYQWDLNASNIAASKTLIFHDTTNTYWGQHQLGPDGRIYITQVSPDTLSPANFALSIIHEPNNAGFGCVFQYLGLPLQGRRTSFNLPNLPNYSLGGLLAQTAEAGPSRLICPGASVQLGVPDQSGGAVVFHWSGPFLNDSSAAQPLAKPDSTVWYYLTVTDTANGAPCGLTVDSVLVRVAGQGEIPNVGLGADTLVCVGDSVRLGGSEDADFLYQWTGGGFVAWPDSGSTLVCGAGNYVLTVVNPAGTGSCFLDSDTVRVVEYVNPLPLNPAGRDTVICVGDTIELGVASASCEFQWTPTGSLSDAHSSSPLAWPVVTTVYFLAAQDSAFWGWCAMTRDTVNITVEQPFSHEAPADVSFCVGECFQLGVAGVNGYAYSWWPTAFLTSPSLSLTKAQPSMTMAYTLSIVDPALQSGNCREKRFTVMAIADACNHQSFIAVNGDGVAEVLDLGDHAGRVDVQVFDVAGRLVFGSEDYGNDWSAAKLAHGMYVYRVSVEGDCPSSFTGKIAVFH